jgi:hypothetical protein
MGILVSRQFLFILVEAIVTRHSLQIDSTAGCACEGM